MSRVEDRRMLQQVVDALNGESMEDRAEWVIKLHASHAALLRLLTEANEMLQGEGMYSPDGTEEAIHVAEALERDGEEA